MGLPWDQSALMGLPWAAMELLPDFLRSQMVLGPSAVDISSGVYVVITEHWSLSTPVLQG